MDQIILKQRTKSFSLRILKLVDALPKTVAGRAISSQLIRSGTSIGANFRSACRGRSKAEFIAKLGVVLEEADETVYWLELITESNMLSKKQVVELHKEADSLAAIFFSMIRSAKQNAK